MSWTEQEIQAAWDNAPLAERTNPRKWRKDSCGAWICRDRYGDHNSVFGWEIHLAEAAENDSVRDLSTLRPLQWKNAASGPNGKLNCRVTAWGGGNVELRS